MRTIVVAITVLSSFAFALAANRVLIRTKGYLWSLGDPDQPFPVSEDWPERGRVNKP